MDVRIEAAPMAAETAMVTATVKTVVILCPVTSLTKRVASFSCPSIGGTSISAVSPDHNYLGGLAAAA